MSAAAAIEFEAISKRFGAVQANRAVSLAIARGSIHGIIGENGAGKSTLMSILYGFYQADSGVIKVNGQLQDIRRPADAMAAGIGMVHQHFMLVDELTVLENVMLGAEGGVLLDRARRSRAEQTLASLSAQHGLAVAPHARVGGLPVGVQQRVEILKALYRGARILILDEPSGVLTPQEADALFAVLSSLRRQGVTILLITHKLREVLAVTDTVSVMRQGEVAATLPTAQANAQMLADRMVGRPVALALHKPIVSAGAPVLQVDGLVVAGAAKNAVDGITFAVRSGEIVGIAGVAGNGQSELLETLAGMRPVTGGCFRLGDVAVTPEQPKTATQMRALGVAHVPEDRQKRGLVGAFSAAESAVLGYHDDKRWNGFLRMHRGDIHAHCEALMHDLEVRPTDPQLATHGFSGGNQQKLLVARELAREPRLLLAGQPTRGVDIGAIELIHARLLAMRARGVAIVLVSVELDEIRALADRIFVMSEGRFTGSLRGGEADEHRLGLMMADASTATLQSSP
ncbi:MAG: ATP-binding cassette domain-containing protein [Gammaproteobacteria bacterium]|nr:ATP-binding cassette domain-containing protein [Gammaproteobacteria bacterium]